MYQIPRRDIPGMKIKDDNFPVKKKKRGKFRGIKIQEENSKDKIQERKKRKKSQVSNSRQRISVRKILAPISRKLVSRGQYHVTHSFLANSQ